LESVGRATLSQFPLRTNPRVPQKYAPNALVPSRMRKITS
jgi:hypothetical protein